MRTSSKLQSRIGNLSPAESMKSVALEMRRKLNTFDHFYQ